MFWLSDSQAVYRERRNGAGAAEATPQELWGFREVKVVHL